MTAEPSIDLERIGLDAQFRAALAAAGEGLQPARVAIAHGESYVVWTAQGPCKGILVGRRLTEWRASPDRPQVGDWVAGTYSAAAAAWIIEQVLPRRTCLMRMAVGVRAVPQVLATNVDFVGIVSALGAGHAAKQRRLINEARILRYLTAVNQSGAAPLLIVNKVDLSEDAAAIRELLSQAFPSVPVLLTSATEGTGLAALSARLAPSSTLGLIGMSGVGKSTLVNALVDGSAQRVGSVRDGDGRGRHTTTHRELFRLANGSLLIDMPGTREFAVWGADEKVEHARGKRRRGRSSGRPD